MSRATELRRRIHGLTWCVIVGLVVSGATAIPLGAELDWLAAKTGAEQLVVADGPEAPAWAQWLVRVQAAVEQAGNTNTFLFYGTDWLAFGHFVIAIAFIGALRDPVRNRWLFDFGLIACALLIPYALVFGALRGIPPWWRMIDCSFGLLGFIPLWLCRQASRELERMGSNRNVS
jgi:hypothetical protein